MISAVEVDSCSCPSIAAKGDFICSVLPNGDFICSVAPKEGVLICSVIRYGLGAPVVPKGGRDRSAFSNADFVRSTFLKKLAFDVVPGGFNNSE